MIGATLLLFQHLDHLERTLNSLVGFVDALFVLDTTVDDTVNQKLIAFTTENHIHYESLKLSFINFGTTKTQLMNFVHNKAECLFTIDSGEVICYSGSDNVVCRTRARNNIVKHFKENKADNIIMLHSRFPGLRFMLPRLIRGSVQWEYIGAAHEYIQAVPTGEVLGTIMLGENEEAIWVERVPELCMGDYRDYALDEKLLLDEVNRYYLGMPHTIQTARSLFYLAQTYFDQGEWAKAYDYYRDRASLSFFKEEDYLSLLRCARCAQLIEPQWFPVAMDFYLKAYDKSCSMGIPQIDGLLAIAQYYATKEHYYVAKIYLDMADRIPYPEKALLFVSPRLYSYDVHHWLGVVCFYTNDYEQGKANCLLAIENASCIEHVNTDLSNLKFYPLNKHDLTHLLQTQGIFLVASDGTHPLSSFRCLEDTNTTIVQAIDDFFKQIQECVLSFLPVVAVIQSIVLPYLLV